MNTWTIGKRITAGFAAVLAIVLALAFFIRLRTVAVARDFTLVAENTVPSLLHVTTVQARVHEILGTLYPSRRARRS